MDALNIDFFDWSFLAARDNDSSHEEIMAAADKRWRQEVRYRKLHRLRGANDNNVLASLP